MHLDQAVQIVKERFAFLSREVQVTIPKFRQNGCRMHDFTYDEMVCCDIYIRAKHRGGGGSKLINPRAQICNFWYLIRLW